MTAKYSIGTQPNPADRRKIEVSDEDAARLEAMHVDDVLNWRPGRRVTVTDYLTGERLVLRTADCGADDRCALEIA